MVFQYQTASKLKTVKKAFMLRHRLQARPFREKSRRGESRETLRKDSFRKKAHRA